MPKLRRIPSANVRGTQLRQDLREAVELARRCTAALDLFVCDAEQMLYGRNSRQGHEEVKQARRLRLGKTRGPRVQRI